MPAVCCDTVEICGRALSPLTLQMRVMRTSSVPFTQATLTSIAYVVTDTADDSVVASASLTVSSVITDTLNTLWDVDSIGFNFSFQIPPSDLPDEDALYEVEFSFVPTVGYSFKSAVNVRT